MPYYFMYDLDFIILYLDCVYLYFYYIYLYPIPIYLYIYIFDEITNLIFTNLVS